MRVAYILNSTVQSNGANMSFREMLSGLMQKGIEPLIVCPDKYEFYDYFRKKGIETITMTYRPAVYPNGFDSIRDYLLFIPRLLARLYVNRKAVNTLTKRLQEFAPALIHTNVGVMDIGYIAAKRLDIPHIFHVREYADKDFGLYFYPSYSRFLRFATAKDSYSICITKDIRQHRRLADIKSSTVIYNGIRKALTQMPHEKKGDYFLYAGRITHTKGLHELLQAYKIYCERNERPYRLLIAGSEVGEKYISEQKEYVRVHGLDGQTEFLGRRTDLDELMQQARATVVPSLHEGFGRVMPEAMFNGCPVIVKDVAGSHEQLVNGRKHTGEDIAYHYTTINELSDLLLQVSSASPESLVPLCRKAFNTVNDLYSTESNAEQVLQLYNEILANKEN